MKYSKIIIPIFLLFLLFVLTGCSNEENSSISNSNTSSDASRISANSNLEKEENRVENLLSSSNKVPSETEIAIYSTAIKDRASGRLTNISLTCSALNGSIIEPGQTFSFYNTVGKPTAERGYQEASIIVNHKTEKGIGGGNCQVSSTLYNAVLAVPNLVVTERHEHGKDVTYVPDGKDAAVSYGSLDLKFRNDTGERLRIDASTDNASIVIKIIQLK